MCINSYARGVRDRDTESMTCTQADCRKTFPHIKKAHLEDFLCIKCRFFKYVNNDSLMTKPVTFDSQSNHKHNLRVVLNRIRGQLLMFTSNSQFHIRGKNNQA